MKMKTSLTDDRVGRLNDQEQLSSIFEDENNDWNVRRGQRLDEIDDQNGEISEEQLENWGLSSK